MGITDALRIVWWLAKKLFGFFTGKGWPQGGSSTGGVAIPRPANQQAKDKAKALETENAILRKDQETNHAERAEAIEQDISIKNEDGDVVGIDVIRRRR